VRRGDGTPEVVCTGLVGELADVRDEGVPTNLAKIAEALGAWGVAVTTVV
jgi:hypothetical protein